MAMSLQQIFDTTATHLLKQNAISVRPNSVVEECAYRGENSLMCAVGCLIKDEFYKPDLEGDTVGSYIVQRALKKSGVLAKNTTEKNFERVELLSSLQQVHDGCDPIEWKVALKETAEAFKLNYHVLDTH